ncbi:MAG: SAM-dependent methyltransferase, partial [Pseudonocardiaceae bacterium]
MTASGLISFVGAGPGAPDLLTLRGAHRLAAADVVVWASSLVPAAVLAHCRTGVELHDSAGMTLEDVLAVYHEHPGTAIVRLHSGDVSLYSALTEQIAWCRSHDRAFEIVPGVGSLAAA